MKLLFTIFIIVVCVMFLGILIFSGLFYIRPAYVYDEPAKQNFIMTNTKEQVDRVNYSNYSNRPTNLDGVNLQLTLFGIIISLMAISGVVLGFFGWKEIQNKIEEQTNKSIDNIMQKALNSINNNIVRLTTDISTLKKPLSFNNSDVDNSIYQNVDPENKKIEEF